MIFLALCHCATSLAASVPLVRPARRATALARRRLGTEAARRLAAEEQEIADAPGYGWEPAGAGP